MKGAAPPHPAASSPARAVAMKGSQGRLLRVSIVIRMRAQYSLTLLTLVICCHGSIVSDGTCSCDLSEWTWGWDVHVNDYCQDIFLPCCLTDQLHFSQCGAERYPEEAQHITDRGPGNLRARATHYRLHRIGDAVWRPQKSCTMRNPAKPHLRSRISQKIAAVRRSTDMAA